MVATQSIRQGNSRKVIDGLVKYSDIYNAWSDEPWVNEGADVRVSLICFTVKDTGKKKILNGESVNNIYANLSGGENVDYDLTTAKSCLENKKIAFQGPVKVGPFDIAGDIARDWLIQPNVNGCSNADVLRPWANGGDLTGRNKGKWIIDFGVDRTEENSAFYELPFLHVLTNVKPKRQEQADEGRKTRWWIHGRTGEDFRNATEEIKRYIATPRVAKHRFFVWLHSSVLPDSRLFAIARDDDVTFGLLSSRIHEIWSLAKSSRHGVGNDPTYNAASCFETFPFPVGLTPNLTEEQFDNSQSNLIGEIAVRLNNLRSDWLNPMEWTDRIPEVRDRFPDRIVVKSGHENDLKKRTLTNLYNESPTWLKNVQAELNEAVANAYGWPVNLSENKILSNLLELNYERTK